MLAYRLRCVPAAIGLIAACLVLITVSCPARAFDDDYTQALNGTTLHFRVRGADKSNPYLLILHGGPGFSAHMFYPWGPAIEKAVNVVYLDQRGCGQSRRYTPANPFAAPTAADLKPITIADMLDDIESVREFLHLAKWFVLGHSWGGMLGLEYVAAHPDHVLGFIDMDGVTSYPATITAILDDATAKLEAQQQSSDAHTRSRAALLLKQVNRLKQMPETSDERLFGAFQIAMGPANLYFASEQAAGPFLASVRKAAEAYHIPPVCLTQDPMPLLALLQHDHLSTRDDRRLFARVSVPTLIINGKQDGVVTPAMAEESHRGIHGSELVELDHCGHFPFVEQPQQTADAILAFVKAHS